MIDYNKTIVAALNNILPTYYEMTLTQDSETPCISYMERGNTAQESGETLEYSRVCYQVKVWANDIGTIQKYAVMVDTVMRKLGFKRISSGELYDNNSSMIQKIMAFEALALEAF